MRGSQSLALRLGNSGSESRSERVNLVRVGSHRDFIVAVDVVDSEGIAQLLLPGTGMRISERILACATATKGTVIPKTVMMQTYASTSRPTYGASTKQGTVIPMSVLILACVSTSERTVSVLRKVPPCPCQC